MIHFLVSILKLFARTPNYTHYDSQLNFSLLLKLVTLSNSIWDAISMDTSLSPLILSLLRRLRTAPHHLKTPNSPNVLLQPTTPCL